MKGTIRKLVRDKGFGFITTAPNGSTAHKPEGDYFFHRSTCADRAGFDHLNEGDAVEFDVVGREELDKRDRHKGPRAKNVQRA